MQNSLVLRQNYLILRGADRWLELVLTSFLPLYEGTWNLNHLYIELRRFFVFDETRWEYLTALQLSSLEVLDSIRGSWRNQVLNRLTEAWIQRRKLLDRLLLLESDLLLQLNIDLDVLELIDAVFKCIVRVLCCYMI